MKRFISSLATVALLATTMLVGPVQAAAVAITLTNGNVTTNTTYAVAAGQDFGVTFTSGATFAASDVVTLSLYDSAGALYAQSLQAYSVAADTDADTVNGATTSVDGAFSFATPGKGIYTFTAPSTGTAIKLEAKFPATFAAGIYSLRVVSNKGDFGAIALYVGNANQVSVSATVDPTFTFSLASTNSSLGTLSTSAFSATPVNVNLTYATNAKSGLAISMVSVGLKNGALATDSEIGQTSIDATVPNVTSTYYRYITASGANNAANLSAVTDGTAMAASSAVVPSTTSPVSAVTNVKVNAEISALTPAGNYADTLTFVATPTF